MTRRSKSNIDEFVKAYNDINQLLARRHKIRRKDASRPACCKGIQLRLRCKTRCVMRSSPLLREAGPFKRLADVGITQQLGGDLAVDSTKLTKALTEKPDDVKNLFRNTGGGSSNGIAVQIKALTTNLVVDRWVLQIEG